MVGSLLHRALRSFGHELVTVRSQRIAIELNKNVIRHVEWPETVISDGDAIEVVHFVGGG